MSHRGLFSYVCFLLSFIVHRVGNFSDSNNPLQQLKRSLLLLLLFYYFYYDRNNVCNKPKEENMAILERFQYFGWESNTQAKKMIYY